MASLNKLENGARKNFDKYAELLGRKMADINSVMNMCTLTVAKLDKMIANRNDVINAKRNEQVWLIITSSNNINSRAPINEQILTLITFKLKKTMMKTVACDT